MDFVERIKRYEAIEEARGRPLIVYATSTRPNAHGMLAGDAVREFIDQIDAIQEGAAVDVLIHSTGGDALAAWKLMSVLRERFETVAVLVPFMAFSAATIFSMGADEIVMHPHASLGPIDPQITIKLPDGTQRQFAFEDVGAFLRFVASEAAITEQAYVSAVVEKLLGVVDPVHIGAAKRASELSADVGERLLQMHMKTDEDKDTCRAIAERLNKSFFAHGDAVSRSRARSLYLKIAPNNPPLEKLLWEAYLGIEQYMDLRKPFNPLQHFIANGGAAALTPKAPLALPPNAPAQMVQNLWNMAAQEAHNAMAQPGIEIPYSVVNAIIESPRAGSEFRTAGTLSAARIAGGQVQMAATDKESGWKPVSLPPAA